MKTFLFLLSLLTLASCMEFRLGGNGSRFAKNDNSGTMTTAQLDSSLEANRVERMKLKMM